MRKKTLGTLVAGTALLLVGVGLAVRLWANDKADHMPMIAAVHQAPDGRIFIELADTLYITGQEGELLKSIPLSRFDANNFVGDFAILSNRSIVLQKGRMPDMTFQDVLKASARGSNPQTYGYDEGSVPLQRCDLKTYKCETLSGDDDQYFKASGPFRLAVDRTMQRIIVADTDQQRLALLDYSGKVLATMGGLNFPNAVQVTAPGKLTVADTNDGKFRNYSYADNRITAAEGGTDLSDWMGFSIPNLFFPTGFTQTSDGRNWAVIVDATMHHGLAYRWHGSGKRADRLHLPRGADVLSIISTGDGVLVPDNQHYRIWQFGLNKSPAGYFGSYKLNQIFENDANHLRDYQLLYHQSLWWMIALAAPLLFWATRLQRAIEVEEDDEDWVPEADPDPAPAPSAAMAENSGMGAGAAAAAAGGGMVLPARRKARSRTESITQSDGASAAAPMPSWQGSVGVAGSSKGEFRRYLNRRFPKLGLLQLALSPLLLGIGLWMFVHYTHNDIFSTPAGPALFRYPLMGLLVVMTLLSWVWGLAVGLLERVYITPQGIRYKSAFSGPLGLLNFLLSSWEVRWDQIAEVKLRHKGYGNKVDSWFYVIQDKSGKSQRLSALMWWSPAMLDEGRKLNVLRAEKPSRLREAIQSSALYQAIKTRGKG